ncbi:MAG: RNA polymerase sigma factor [bacterium]|nr:RNA polymerase sigma factor [bacterium]
MNPILEPALLAQLSSGDANAFAAFYDAYARPIFRFVYYRTHHRETAEDLTSATFLKALQHIRTFNPDRGSVGAWIYRIARNTVTDHYRTRRASVDIADVWDLADSQDVARDADVSLQLERIREHMASLTSEQREMVLLRLWDQLSYREIAEITGKSEAACKMSFSRAIAALRGKLGPAAFVALLVPFI